jgi:hypothetical protein
MLPHHALVHISKNCKLVIFRWGLGCVGSEHGLGKGSPSRKFVASRLILSPSRRKAYERVVECPQSRMSSLPDVPSVGPWSLHGKAGPCRAEMQMARLGSPNRGKGDEHGWQSRLSLCWSKAVTRREENGGKVAIRMVDVSGPFNGVSGEE